MMSVEFSLGFRTQVPENYFPCLPLFRTLRHGEERKEGGGEARGITSADLMKASLCYVFAGGFIYLRRSRLSVLYSLNGCCFLSVQTNKAFFP